VALPPRQGTKDAVRGERHPRAKLSEAILAECRTLKAVGETERAIAKRFGVSQSTLHRALAGQTWRETKRVEEPPAGAAEAAAQEPAPEPPRYPWS
jgi:DNA invertase Pin-like site-specific DNA recombinase